MQKKQLRQSNIELLRIFSMFGVIALHYNNPIIGGGIAYSDGVNKIVLYFIESLFVCAVDLFIVISGYFMCINNKRYLRKPFELLFQVIIFSMGIYLLRVFLGNTEFSLIRLIRSVIPTNYFVMLYIAMYLISPMINIYISRLKKESALKVLWIWMLLFSIWPTVVDVLSELAGKQWIGMSTVGMYGSQWGYSLVNFLLMYFLGAYVRKFGINLNKVQCIFGLFLSAVILVGWSFTNDNIGYFTEKSAWEYCNPIVILMALLWFRLFQQMKVKENSLINRLAKASFTVFLVHTMFLGFLKIEDYVTGNLPVMVLHMFMSVVMIYIICWIIHEIYEFTVSRLLNVVLNKISIFQKELYHME